MEVKRKAHTRRVKAATFDDARTRSAIVNPGRRCNEMHCERVAETHSYSEAGCSWVQLESGEIISRTEARETTTRPDRIQ